MLMNVFKEAVIILETIESKGYEAYFVGGSVRDFLLKREVTDVDIASSAPPHIIQQLFPKVIPVGIDHGTVIVRHNGISYEVTTFRNEGTYSDQRHPDEVSFNRSIEEDVKRRDFTMNAIAMDKYGKMIDLYEGRRHIQEKVIQSVGRAESRFTEDPLRIVRALRFSSELGFTIESSTLRAMEKLNEQVATVAVERLATEFTKLFCGEYIDVGMSYLFETEIDKHVPIFNDNRHLLRKLPQKWTAFHSFGEVIAFFHYADTTIEIGEWVKKWKSSNNVRNEAINLSESIQYYEKKGLDDWLVYWLNKTYFNSFIHLLQLLFQEEIPLEKLTVWKRNLPIQSKNELALNGYDIMKVFPDAERGKWISEIITSIEREVVCNRLENKKNAIKEWIKCHPPGIN